MVAVDIQILQSSGMQSVDNTKALDILPEEPHKAQLAQNAHDLGGSLFPDNNSMNARSKDLDCLGQICVVVDKGRWFLSPKKVLYVGERDRLIGTSSPEHVGNFIVVGIPGQGQFRD